eukprot:6205927-Pleurochrysis_carterae.AAC.3
MVEIGENPTKCASEYLAECAQQYATEFNVTELHGVRAQLEEASKVESKSQPVRFSSAHSRTHDRLREAAVGIASASTVRAAVAYRTRTTNSAKRRCRMLVQESRHQALVRTQLRRAPCTEIA